jgi:hypothetical protein
MTREKKVFSLLFLTLILFVQSPASGDTVSIGAAKDNTLYEDLEGDLSNGAGDGIFVGRTNGAALRRGVIAFDIPGNVPAGSTINSVVLSLNMSKTNTGAQTVELHRLLADWGEGTSNSTVRGGGMGAPATENDATWQHTFFDTVFWSSDGGDFSPTVSGSQSVTDIGSYSWASTVQMVADVQGWLDSPSGNFGWILIGNEAVNQTAKRFDSKDIGNISNRPGLSIDFTPPVDPPTPTETASPIPSDTPTTTETATSTPSDSPTATETPPPVATPTASATPSPSDSPTATNTAVPSATPTESPSLSDTPTASATPSPIDSPAATNTVVPSETPTPEETPDSSASPTPTGIPGASATPTTGADESPTPTSDATGADEFDLMDDDRIDARDLALILTTKPRGEIDSSTLFDFARFWDLDFGGTY